VLTKLALAALVAAVLTALGAPAASATPSDPNHASYWGDDCYKVDHGVGDDGATLIVDSAYRLVVLKSATNNDEFYNVQAGDHLTTLTGQGISHYILCTTVPTSSTTIPATTTTVPATTTTIPTSSTTIPATTTTSTTTTLPGTITSVPTTTVPATTTTVPTTTVPGGEIAVVTTTAAPTTTVTPPTTIITTDGTLASTPPENLAFTGANVEAVLVFALGLFGLGTGLVMLGRRVRPAVVEQHNN